MYIVCDCSRPLSHKLHPCCINVSLLFCFFFLSVCVFACAPAALTVSVFPHQWRLPREGTWGAGCGGRSQPAGLRLSEEGGEGRVSAQLEERRPAGQLKCVPDSQTYFFCEMCRCWWSNSCSCIQRYPQEINQVEFLFILHCGVPLQSFQVLFTFCVCLFIQKCLLLHDIQTGHLKLQL